VGGAPRGQQVVKALQNVGNGDYRVNVNGLPVGMYVKAIRLGGDDVLRDGLRVYGSISNTLEIILSASAGTVEGVVVDDQRRPFTNATIALVPSLGLRQSRLDLFKTTHSGTDGRFRIVSVPPGEYKLFAWEEIQTGDWYNPDFMQNEELRGVTVRVTERNTESHVLPVIPMDGSAR
jgi:hypothetical protein